MLVRADTAPTMRLCIAADVWPLQAAQPRQAPAFCCVPKLASGGLSRASCAWLRCYQLLSLPPRPAALQGGGPATAAVFNTVLSAALSAGQFGVVLELLQLMRAGGLEVDPALASMVRPRCPPNVCTQTASSMPLWWRCAQMHWAAEATLCKACGSPGRVAPSLDPTLPSV